MSWGQGVVTISHTQSHDLLEVAWAEFDHNRISVAVNDFGIMGMPVTDTIFSFNFLDGCQTFVPRTMGGAHLFRLFDHLTSIRCDT